MPKVKFTLSSFEDISFVITKEVDYDNGDWAEMSVDQRQEMINEDGEQFMCDKVEWDYKVLP